MGRPQGTGNARNIEDAGEGTPEGGEEDVTPLAPIEENPEDINAQPGGDADPDGGGADPEAGADGVEKEGSLPPEGQEPGVQDNPRIEALERELAELKAQRERPEEKPKPFTEEEWTKAEHDWGVPRGAIDRITKQNVQVVNKIMDYIDSKMAPLLGSDVIQQVAREPGFSDATRYRNEIRDFMTEFSPQAWSNPALIKKAVVYARGVHASANVNRARGEQERNRRIAGSARPTAPSASGRRTTLPALTADQKQVAEMMGGEGQYNKFRRNGRVTIEQ